MVFLDAIILFLAGVLAGAVNAVAGGGTFLAFGVLTLVGVAPITANATSAVAQLPGYVTSTLAYWRDISRVWRGALEGLACVRRCGVRRAAGSTAPRKSRCTGSIRAAPRRSR